MDIDSIPSALPPASPTNKRARGNHHPSHALLVGVCSRLFAGLAIAELEAMLTLDLAHDPVYILCILKQIIADLAGQYAGDSYPRIDYNQSHPPS